MEKLQELSNIIFENADKIPDGIYKDLLDRINLKFLN